MLLLKLGVGLVEDDRRALRQVVADDAGNTLVGRLGKGYDLIELGLLFRIVVDVEVRTSVDPEIEVLVGDLVLAELRPVGRVADLRLLVRTELRLGLFYRYLEALGSSSTMFRIVLFCL